MHFQNMCIRASGIVQPATLKASTRYVLAVLLFATKATSSKMAKVMNKILFAIVEKATI